MDMTLLDKLQSDGDSVEIGDGRTLKLMFRPDEESFENIGDHGEVYGETRWTRDGDYGAIRPDHFTGAAEILKRDGNYSLWWEPYDLKGLTGGREGENFANYRTMVSEIMEWGFYIVGLKLTEEVQDSRGGTHRVEVASAYCGGIEPMCDLSADYREIMEDLVAQIEDEMGGEI